MLGAKENTKIHENKSEKKKPGAKSSVSLLSEVCFRQLRSLFQAIEKSVSGN